MAGACSRSIASGRCRREAFAGVTHVLTSIAPDEAGDPVLDRHEADLRGAHWIGYLGTTAVYGDRQGGWVDEETAIEPTLARADRRARAEAAWLGSGLPVHIFRLAGIYGPGRNALRQPEGGHGAADREAGAGVLAHPCRGHRHRARGLDRPAAAGCDLQCLRRRTGAAAGRGSLRRRAPGRGAAARAGLRDRRALADGADLLQGQPPGAERADQAGAGRDGSAYPSYREGLSALLAVDG